MKNYLDRPNVVNPAFNVINNRSLASDADTFNAGDYIE